MRNKNKRLIDGRYKSFTGTIYDIKGNKVFREGVEYRLSFVDYSNQRGPRVIYLPKGSDAHDPTRGQSSFLERIGDFVEPSR